MNTLEFAQNLSFVMPDAAIMVSDDGAALPPTLVHGTRAVQIPTFTVCRGFIIGKSGVEATTPCSLLSPADLMHATVDAVLGYALRIHQRLYDAGVPEPLTRTVVFVSPNLDPEAVDVGVYVFSAGGRGPGRGAGASRESPKVTPIQEFLSGKPNPEGLTVQWVLDAADEDLERRHNWVQWAFPTDKPSRFHPEAPVVTLEEMRNLTPQQVRNLIAMAGRFAQFLARGVHWRHAHSHNHLRITRCLTSLKMAGADEQRNALYAFAMKHGRPNAETERFWAQAL